MGAAPGVTEAVQLFRQRQKWSPTESRHNPSEFPEMISLVCTGYGPLSGNIGYFYHQILLKNRLALCIQFVKSDHEEEQP